MNYYLVIRSVSGGKKGGCSRDLSDKNENAEFTITCLKGNPRYRKIVHVFWIIKVKRTRQSLDNLLNYALSTSKPHREILLVSFRI